MQAKFAKAIAGNVREIAFNAATVAFLDQLESYDPEISERRVKCMQRIDKAEQNIASLLQQPGAWPAAQVG